MSIVENYYNANTTTTVNNGRAIAFNDISVVVANNSDFVALAGVNQFRFMFNDGSTEVLLCTNISGTTWTILRGQEGTNPTGHADGIQIIPVITATGIQNIVRSTNIVGTLANRPTVVSSRVGDQYHCTDTPFRYICDGTVWQPFYNNVYLYPPERFTWAWVNQGAATRDSSLGGIYVQAPALAGQNNRLLTKAIPTAPYTITVGFIQNGPMLLSGGSGLALYDNVSGKMMYYDTYEIASGAGATARALQIYQWNSPSSSAQIPAGFVTAYPASSSSIIWMRITDDGITRTYSYSFDGIHFIQHFQEPHNTWITPTHIALMTSSENVTFPMGCWFVTYREA